MTWGWVGNDVVDLGDPEAADAHRRERFVQRVLGPEELELFRADPDPKSALWRFFAAKEAAYKVAVKLRPETRFLPRRFTVSADRRSVLHDDLRISLELTVVPELVHAVAYLGPRPRSAVAESGGDASADARALLVRSVAQDLGCPIALLEVVRVPAPGAWDGKAPPRLTLRGTPLALDASLSHHGRFVACAHGLMVPEHRPGSLGGQQVPYSVKSDRLM